MNGLMMHAGGAKVKREALEQMATPAATRSWCPVPHSVYLHAVERALQRRNLRVVNEEHGVRGEQYFGLLTVQNGHNSKDYSWVVGLRNSHNKTLPAGLVVGSQVFVCDNLAFSGEIQVTRKHTTHIMAELPGLIEGAVLELTRKWVTKDERIARYRAFALPEAHAHNLIIHALENGAITAIKVPEVVREYHKPSHVEFASRTMWSLFNAFTQVLKGASPMILQERTIKLHNLFDSYRMN